MTNTEKTKKTKNTISILIGNGFDIQILKELNVSTNTSYSSFFNFISWKYSNMLEENLIVRKMVQDRMDGKENWSDFEETIKNIIKSEYENKDNEPINEFSSKKYIEALTELQDCFSDFLNTIVTTDVLKRLDMLGETPEVNNGNLDGNDVIKPFKPERSLAMHTLRSFLGDLQNEERSRMEFVKNADHHTIYDFTFFNFNYTPLFDNYIMLDKKAFDPHMYKYSSNNFHLQLRFKENEKEVVFTELETRIFHPHGFQHTPRSILFGFDNPGQVIKNYNEDLYTNSEVQNYVKYFLKPYWAENDKKYKPFLENTDLYIIFGHSIGESDRYWWKIIAENIANEKAELIIYNFSIDNTDAEKNRVALNFIDKAGLIDETKRDKVLKRIFVINFNQTKPRYAFNVNQSNIPQ